MNVPVSIPAKPRVSIRLKSLGKKAPARRVPKGARTRESILHVAVNLASVEGLEGISIGRLADELRMSKSGLFAHFGSKEDLQLATVDAAREIFIEHVVRPALAQPKGMPRLWSLCDNWLGYVEQRVFAGGCFFAAASFEFDSRPGPVRNRIVMAMKEWLDMLTRAIEDAKQLGDIKVSVDPRQLALEIYSLAIGALWGFQLLGEKKALDNARTAILSRLRTLVASPAKRRSSRKSAR